MNLSRNVWYRTLHKMTDPVFSALAEGRLRECMPVHFGQENRGRGPRVCHLEAVGRSLAGLGPWLAAEGLDGEEADMQNALFEKVVAGLAVGLDPQSPDRLDFIYENELRERQPLVDAAFLCHGMLRSGGNIWAALDRLTQQRLVDALQRSRKIIPPACNWLLFSSTIEVFLRSIGAEWDALRIEAAVRAHEGWYLGDGWYGDGPTFMTNYYNSFVIHPMLLDALAVLAQDDRLLPETRLESFHSLSQTCLERAQQYILHQIRMVAPDGSFPALGRSITYRCGAFQLLAQLAWEDRLPENVSPGLSRTCLSRVIHRTLFHPDTFDEAGWLQLGLCGHQPELAEGYISTGSLYLATTAFLPLGLPASAPFWSDPDETMPWEECWPHGSATRPSGDSTPC